MSTTFYYIQGEKPTYYLDWSKNHEPISFAVDYDNKCTVVRVSNPNLSGLLYDLATEAGYTYKIPDALLKLHGLNKTGTILDQDAIREPSIEEKWSIDQVTNNKVKSKLEELEERCKANNIII